MKAGDTVRLHQGLEIGKMYSGVTLSTSMAFEDERVIAGLDEGYINIDGWLYSTDMLELVRES